MVVRFCTIYNLEGSYSQGQSRFQWRGPMFFDFCFGTLPALAKKIARLLFCSIKEFHGDAAILTSGALTMEVDLCFRSKIYLRPRPTSHKINPTTRTIRMIAVQKPALKIPPTTWQE